MIKFIEHKDISNIELDEIICIKSISWQFSYECQLKWIDHHLKKSDIHVLYYEGNSLQAYANLIPIPLIINENELNVLGVGNVCTKMKGKGYGVILMNILNDYIVEKNSMGCLFCKDILLNFYTRLNWTHIEKQKVLLNNVVSQDVNTLIYNCNSYVNNVHFKGVLF